MRNSGSLIVKHGLSFCLAHGHRLNCIEIFHRKFLKSLLKLNRGTANCMVYDKVGRFALASKVEKRMINFGARVSQGKKSKLSYIIYSLLRKLHESCDFESRWIVKDKSILDKSGMSNLSVEDTPLNLGWVKSAFDLRLNDIDL